MEKVNAALAIPTGKGGLPLPCAYKCFHFRTESIFSCCLFFKRLYISLKFKKNSKPRENTELKHT